MWGLAGYIACFLIVALMTGGFTSDFLQMLIRGDSWQPTEWNRSVPAPMINILLFVCVLALLFYLWKYLRTLKEKRRPKLLLARLLITGLCIFLYAASMIAVGRARSLWDERTVDAMNLLKVGQPEVEVKKILEGRKRELFLDDFRQVSGRDFALVRRCNQGAFSDIDYYTILSVVLDDERRMRLAEVHWLHWHDAGILKCSLLGSNPAEEGIYYPVDCPEGTLKELGLKE